MTAAEKVQCPVRLYESDYLKIRNIAQQDGLNFQKVAEVLLLHYLKGDQRVVGIIKKYLEQRKKNKRKGIDETELTSIFDKIESKSPIRHQK